MAVKKTRSALSILTGRRGGDTRGRLLSYFLVFTRFPELPPLLSLRCCPCFGEQDSQGQVGCKEDSRMTIKYLFTGDSQGYSALASILARLQHVKEGQCYLEASKAHFL